MEDRAILDGDRASKDVGGLVGSSEAALSADLEGLRARDGIMEVLFDLTLDARARDD